MNIINVGGWYVGNSAILDWMGGVKEIAVIKGDFNIVRLENGIMDMISEQDKEKKLLMITYQQKQSYKGFYWASRMLIGRYTKRLFEKKTIPSYYGHFKFHKIFLKYLKEYKDKVILGEPFDEVVFWQSWLNTLPSLSSEKNNFEHIVYQNPFFYDTTYDGHSDIWPNLFGPYKMIFVHRDPLDQFSDIVNGNAHLDASWPRFHGDTKDMDPAERFLTISKKIFQARLEMADKHTENELIILSFEDFLQKHELVTSKLCTFLNLNPATLNCSSNFDLSKSLKNVGVGKNNLKALSLLEGKDYILDELYSLREQLKSHDRSI